MVPMKRYVKWLGIHAAMMATLVVLAAISVTAQLPTGTFLGTVKDATGGAVAGATVTATNIETGFTRTGTTDADGSYRFPAMPVGNYEITVTKDGFQKSDRKGLTLEVAQQATIDATLQVGSTSQSVVVTEEAPIVDTTSSSSGSLVNEDKITDLPLNGRNWTDLTLMQTGIVKVNALTGNVTTAELNGTFYISNGAATRSNMYLLDGADERTLIGINNTSVTNSSLGVDGIQEYKVVNVLPSAEYALTMGSQTLIVSKGGTNNWHGDAFDFLRNASMDAESYGDPRDTGNLNGCGADKALVFACKRVEPYQRNNFGGAFGGPIKKDKTFFYAVFEGIRSSQGIASEATTLPAACFVNGTIPAVIANNGCVAGSATTPITVNQAILPLANEFPTPNVNDPSAYPTFNVAFPFKQPTSEEYGQIRIDQNFSAANSGFFRYTQDDADMTTIRQNVDPRSLENIHGNETFATLGETHIFSPTLLNTARLSFSRTLANLFPFIESNPSALPANYPAFTANSNTLLVPSLADNPQQMPGTASPGQITQVTTITNPGCTPVPPSTTNCSAYGAATPFFSTTGPNNDTQNIYTLSDDIYWTKGKHGLKFGTLMNRFNAYPLDVLGNAGSAGFPGIGGSACPGSNCPLQAYFLGNYNSLGRDIPNSNYARQFRFYTFGFYAQDDYKVLSRLTLNLGFRYEFTTVPTETKPAIAFSLRDAATDATGTAGGLFKNPSLHNFSPRVGFAWDVFGNGKTALRGGGGIYYDTATYGDIMLNNSIGAPKNVPGGYISSAVTYTNNGVHPPLDFPVSTDFTNSNLVATSPGSPRTVNYNISQPTLFQRSLAIDQQLPWGMGLTIAYVGTNDWHLYQSRDGNPQAYYATTAGAAPTTCPGIGCTAVGVGPNMLPYYCSPADGTPGAPTAAHPCSALATFIPCTTKFTAPAGNSPGCPGKINPAWNQIQEVMSSGSSYNSLQISVNKRPTHGLQFQFGYTWSKSLDDGEAQSALENVLNLFQVPLGFPENSDRGPSVFNATNNIRTNIIYHVPDLIKSRSMLEKVTNGWWFSVNLAAQRGYPLTPQN